VGKNFKTKLELSEEEQKYNEEQRKLKILNDPYVKEAEKIFNAKIDKIILND
jgi:DNA polymerase-3 subunit gamma/tau